MASIAGSGVDIYIDLLGGTSYKKVICLTEGSIDINTPINRTQTNCGSKVATGVPEVTISGTFEAETAPGVNDVSLESILANAVSPTLITCKVDHPAGAGTDFYLQGSGYITGFTINWATEENVSFDATIEITGTPDVTP